MRTLASLACIFVGWALLLTGHFALGFGFFALAAFAVVP